MNRLFSLCTPHNCPDDGYLSHASHKKSNYNIGFTTNHSRKVCVSLLECLCKDNYLFQCICEYSLYRKQVDTNRNLSIQPLSLKASQLTFDDNISVSSTFQQTTPVEVKRHYGPFSPSFSQSIPVLVLSQPGGNLKPSTASPNLTTTFSLLI